MSHGSSSYISTPYQDIHPMLRGVFLEVEQLNKRIKELSVVAQRLDSALKDHGVSLHDIEAMSTTTTTTTTTTTFQENHDLKKSSDQQQQTNKRHKDVIDDDDTNKKVVPNLFPEIRNVAEKVSGLNVADSTDTGDIEGLTTIEDTRCMKCGESGTTRMLLVTIPFFREVILMSFECPECGERNNEVQSGEAIQPQGCLFTLNAFDTKDLSRHVVKSEYAAVKFVELDFEIPPERGCMTTIEGLLREAYESLSSSQITRRLLDPESAGKIDEFLQRLEKTMNGEMFPFTMTLSDPSGNSFVENPVAPHHDPQLKEEHFQRTLEQHVFLGFQPDHYQSDKLYNPDSDDKQNINMKLGGIIPKNETLTDRSLVEKEVLEFPTSCPNCKILDQTAKMYVTDIPFFKEIVIMAFNCDECGFKSNEIKGAGAIPDKGSRTTLWVNSKEADPKQFGIDMARDVIKSNTAGVFLPDLEIEVTQGSLGGVYTTVEGLITMIKDKLFQGMMNDMAHGDSSLPSQKTGYQLLEEKFNDILSGRSSFTITIEDPLSNSYIYNPMAPEQDPQLSYVEYERTHHENEELGLLDMNVDNYDELCLPITAGEKNDNTSSSSERDKQRTMDSIEAVKNLQKTGQEAHPNANFVKGTTESDFT